MKVQLCDGLLHAFAGRRGYVRAGVKHARNSRDRNSHLVGHISNTGAFLNQIRHAQLLGINKTSPDRYRERYRHKYTTCLDKSQEIDFCALALVRAACWRRCGQHRSAVYGKRSTAHSRNGRACAVLRIWNGAQRDHRRGFNTGRGDEQGPTASRTVRATVHSDVTFRPDSLASTAILSRFALAPAPASSYKIAPVAQRLTQAGSPPHMSQMRARPVSGCRATIPKGHASTQAEQPIQSSGRRRIAPVPSFLNKASVGQAATQGARQHRRQTWGWSTPACSILVTRRRAVAVPNRPSCRATHAISQARQPLQISSRTRIRFIILCNLC